MEIKTITLPTRDIEVEVYAPAEKSEKVPAILLLHELFGVLDVYREDAQSSRPWLFGLCTQFI